MATAGTVLNIGSGSGQNHFNLGVARDGDGSITTKTQAELVTYNESPYFSIDDTGVWTNFAVRLDGVTTEGSTYPRSELRELDTDGTTLYGFNPTTGDHWMQGRTIIDTLAAWKRAMVIGQLHDTISDVIMIASQNVEPSPYVVGGDTKIVVRINGGAGSGGLSLTAIPLYIPGTQIPWKIRTGSIGWEVYIGDLTTPMFKSSDPGMQALAASGLCYHKAGCYSNTNATVEAGAPLGNGSPSTFHVKCRLRDLKHWHTSWPTPQVMTSGTNFTPGTGVISNVRWGTKAEGRQLSANAGINITPALPASLAAGDVMLCVVRCGRESNVAAGTAYSSNPSTPNPAGSDLDNNWERLLNFVTTVAQTTSPPELVGHLVRFQLWARKWQSGDAAPVVAYPGGTTLRDVMNAQIVAFAGGRQDLDDLIDQAPAGLNFAAATSLTTLGPTNALPANARAGSLALAFMAHENHITSGAAGVTSGDGLTWAEGGEGVLTTGTAPNWDGFAWANDWALVPTSQAIAAKSCTGTVYNDANVAQTSPATQNGKGWGVLLTVKPEPPITHGIINACAGSS